MNIAAVVFASAIHRYRASAPASAGAFDVPDFPGISVTIGRPF
jgi:hypothetical protein